MMKLTGETKLFMGIIGATILIIVAGIVFMSRPSQVLQKSALVTDGAYSLGNKDAKTYLVEFSDFQCPACKVYEPAIDEIVNKNKDKMLFVYRYFPLDQHPFSRQSAQAAEAAGQQGKFWEMYKMLFENQEKFSDSLFTELAQKLNLDMEKFKKAMDDSTIKSKIAADRTYGESIGVDATPTFFLNGLKLESSSFDDFKKQIEKSINSNK